MPIDARAQHELYVIEGLLRRLAWAYNCGGMELVRADIGGMERALRQGSNEPASWVLDEWLAEQVQQVA